MLHLSSSLYKASDLQTKLALPPYSHTQNSIITSFKKNCSTCRRDLVSLSSDYKSVVMGFHWERINVLLLDVEEIDVMAASI
jgi:hypothetical protein